MLILGNYRKTQNFIRNSLALGGLLHLGVCNAFAMQNDPIAQMQSLRSRKNVTPEESDRKIYQQEKALLKELASVEPKDLPIMQLQQSAKVSSKTIKVGTKTGQVDLINVNSNVNVWFLLKIKWPKDGSIGWYHLENKHPDTQTLAFSPSFDDGIVINRKKGPIKCDFWSAKNNYSIETAKSLNKPYIEICNKSIYLRNTLEGYRTTKEWVVEFLRDNLWGAETITNIVKNTIFKDAFFINGAKKQLSDSSSSLLSDSDKNAPPQAMISSEFRNRFISSDDLGIEIKDQVDDSMLIGRWYESKKQPNVYISAIEVDAIEESILTSHKDYVADIDSVEAKAINYLVAFDTSKFDLNFALGTEHPRVHWSSRARPDIIDTTKPGPDGFATALPLAPTGLIPPDNVSKIAATFTGGFKRSHGAFKWGENAVKNNGTHYGFMENGFIFSKIQEGLASIIVDINGNIQLKTWAQEDNKRLARLRHVRQNGVAVIEYDQVLKKGVPGKFVSNWTMGNWSGSQDSKFRTLRAGICQLEVDDKSFIIYGYFSSVTPTAMARVFQAYGCNYALHLDMNALEHTYLAIYDKDKTNDSTPSHLIKGMKVLDERFQGNVPRFIGYPDNRDFFYFTSKGG